MKGENVMILYLSSIEHTNLWDFLWEQEKEKLPIKKLVEKFSLKKFVLYDMRNFAHVTELVLNRIAFDDSDEEVAEAIEEFLMMYRMRITLIYEELKQEDMLFQLLLEKGVRNFVCDTKIQAIKEELKECFREEGMTRYQQRKKIEEEIQEDNEEKKSYIFACETVRIALLSSQTRIGVTTIAVSLCTWLESVGATVCYVEEWKKMILIIWSCWREVMVWKSKDWVAIRTSKVSNTGTKREFQFYYF